MENEPELIRDQMQETRTALTEKLEALESQVSGTVQSATAAVTETVEAVKSTVAETVGTVKDSVQETVSTVKESVKDAFDLPAHIERHPWAAMLGSVAVGYLGGRVLNGMAGGMHHERQQAPQAYKAFSEALPKSEAGTNGHGANGAHKENEASSEEEGVARRVGESLRRRAGDPQGVGTQRSRRSGPRPDDAVRAGRNRWPAA